jgi:hypothetical protein
VSLFDVEFAARWRACLMLIFLEKRHLAITEDHPSLTMLMIYTDISQPASFHPNMGHVAKVSVEWLQNARIL